jgi:hypothetical protein
MTKFISIDKDTQEKKETVFTHIQNPIGWVSKQDILYCDYNTILHIGFCSIDGDLFAGYGYDFIDILKGTKGDEFN